MNPNPNFEEFLFLLITFICSDITSDFSSFSIIKSTTHFPDFSKSNFA